MLAKFSVKKPLTVFVAVVLVLILGYVSFTEMTPDLLPNIDLPYVVVMTTYPGATPEKVETIVTKPLEQAMATLTDVNEISSTSLNSASMIILEFADTVNMDAVGVDIREKISLVQGYWDDMVGTPTVLKLNPNMLPVAVAAVNREGYDNIALTRLLEDSLLNQMEGTGGVASISTMGLVNERIEIQLNHEKIEKINQKIQASIDEKFADPLREIEENQQKIQDGYQEIQTGKNALITGKKELSSKEKEISSQFLTQEKALQEQLSQLEELEKNYAFLSETLASLQQARAGLLQIQAVYPTLQESESVLTETLQTLNGMQKAVEQANMVIEQEDPSSQAYIMAQAVLSEMEAQLQSMGSSVDKLPEMIASAQNDLTYVTAQRIALEEELAKANLTYEQLPAALQAMDEQIAQLENNLQTVNEILTQNPGAKEAIAEGLQLLNEQKVLVNEQMDAAWGQVLEGEKQITDAEKQLEDGAKQLDDALEQLKKAKEDAYKQADLNKILSLDTISGILTAQHFSMPVGYIRNEAGEDTLLRVGETFASLEEMESMLLIDMHMDGLSPIRLSDIADVQLMDNHESSYARINGNDGIILSFFKQSSYATADVCDNINKTFKKLMNQYDGLEFSFLMDQGEYIHLIVDSILGNLLYGAILAIIILLLFLWDIKPTLIVACSIPFSVVFAIVLMYFSGVTLNLISLSGLAVGVGMLVDNSVVVIENIYRIRAQEKNTAHAVILGATQVTGAITSSTLTTVCVFLPIVFVKGLTRQLFADMALTVSYSLLASLLVAITLIPAMSQRMLRKVQPKKQSFFTRCFSAYDGVLSWTLKHPVYSILFTLVLLFGSFGLLISRGFSFIPDMSSSQISGSLSFAEEMEKEETKRYANEAAERIASIEGVKTVGIMQSDGGSALAGMSMLTGGSDEEGQSYTLYIILEDQYASKSMQVSKEIEKCCEDLPGELKASGIASVSESMGMLTGSGVTVQVFADDLKVLQNTSRDIAQIIAKVDGIAQVNDGIEETANEITVVVDKEKAMDKGLMVAQVYQSISTALPSSKNSITLEDTNVVIKLDERDILTSEALKDFILEVTDHEGVKQEVKLSQIAEISTTQSLASIQRLNQKRYLTVQATPEQGQNSTLIAQKVQSALKDYSVQEGVSVLYTGESEAIWEAIFELCKMLGLAIVFIYLIMVAQFQSFKSPFIVMFTIPLAFTGAFLALLMTGATISVISMIGFVMLSGIIVNNGIVLIDYINQLRQDGWELQAALHEAGKTRMRPILMTVLTTVLGLSIMAFGRGTGAEMMQPIAWVCIGGLLYATVMTLLLIPVLYYLFNKRSVVKPVGEEQEETI